MINTKTKGELGRRIEYDVEHDIFHPQNIYSDEYITPTFVEYVQKLEKENAELKSENQKWKDEWQEQVQKANDEGYARTLQTIQLTKAKEILREYIRINLLSPIERNFDDEVKLFKQAEQFISEEYQKSNETKE